MEFHDFKLQDHIAGVQEHPSILLPKESDVLVKVDFDTGSSSLEIYGHKVDSLESFYRIDYNLIDTTIDEDEMDSMKYHKNLH